MIAFALRAAPRVVDDHRQAYGVEAICKVLPIAPSSYREHVAQRRDPAKLSARAQRDLKLKPEIARVFAENFAVYRVRKVWRQLRREGFAVARCTVERLMVEMGLQGVIRGKTVRTTVSDKAAPCPLDPCEPPVSCARAQQAMAVRLHLRRHLGGLRLRRLCHRRLRPAYRRLARQPHGARQGGFVALRVVPDAPEQALHERRPQHRGGLIHHSDRGSQYLSIKYTERLAEAGVEPSVGSVGDSYDCETMGAAREGLTRVANDFVSSR